MKSLVLLILLMGQFAYASIAGLSKLPVQDNGRIKPFDTFAKETLQLVYGKQKFNKKSAVEVVFTWMLVPDHWESAEIILIRDNSLREALQLDKKRVYYSPKELLMNEKVGLLIQEARTLVDQKKKLNTFYKEVQQLETRITIFQAVKIGEGLRVLPQSDSDKWLTIARLPKEWSEKFNQITVQFAKYAASQMKGEGVQGAKAELKQAVETFMSEAQKEFPDKYGPLSKITVELHYNKMHPFLWAWVLYLIAALLFLASLVNKKTSYYKIAFGISLLALVFHTYGFALRVYITGRAPVTNMFETVVWVAWGAVVLAYILERVYRNKVIMFAGTTVATFSLILCDLSAQVLDSAMNPLQSVLRDNFWLLTHVLIITLSYAAFFLAFVLGDLLLFYYFKGADNYKEEIKNGVNSIYRSLQVGVVLLAGGIILGGIWADYSWGRFWGWDPKESWSLIALMGYLAILHARITGLLRDFGMAISSIVGFSLIIMAWYGVNYVLGEGLHAYGFGTGGVEYVSGFVGVHFLAVLYTSVYTQRLSKKTAAILIASAVGFSAVGYFVWQAVGHVFKG